MNHNHLEEGPRKILSLDTIFKAIEQHRDYFKEEHNIAICYYRLTKNLSPTACLLTVVLANQQDLWGRRFVLQFHKNQDINKAVKEELDKCLVKMHKNPDQNMYVSHINMFGSPTHNR